MWNSSKWKKIIILAVAIAATALIAGGYCYYSFEYAGSRLICIGMSLQNCMESLLFNPILPIHDVVSNVGFMESIGIAERGIMILYSLAMVLAPFVDILIIFSVLDSFMHLFVGIGFKKRRILIVGYNDKVREILERRNKNGKVYLWTEKYLSAEEERDLYLKRVSVKMNNFSLGDSPEEYLNQKNKFNRFIKRKRITDILLLDDSDTKNNQYYMALSTCDFCRKETIHFYVLNKTFEARNMLQDCFDSKIDDIGNPKDTDTHMDLRIFNFDQIQAEELFSELPIYSFYDKDEDCDDKPVHLLIVGGNSLCMYIALHAMNQAVFSPSNKIVIDIVNDSIDSIKKGLSERFNKELVEEEGNEYKIISDKIDGSLKIRLSECRLMDSKLSSVLSELQDADSGRFTYVALCSRIVDENLHAFMCIGQEKIITGEKEVPVAIRMSYSNEMKEYLESYKWCSKLFFMGEDEEYIGLDQIVNLEEEKYIRAYHATYEAVGESRIFSSDSKTSRKDEKDVRWNGLEYFKRQSNRALYHHKMVKEALFKNYEDEMQQFWAQTISDEEERDLIWSQFLIEEGAYPKLLRMAKTEHRRWSYFFASEGWGYSEEKLPKERLHDCLCNWERLKEMRTNTLIYDLISSPLLMESEENVN